MNGEKSAVEAESSLGMRGAWPWAGGAQGWEWGGGGRDCAFPKVDDCGGRGEPAKCLK